MKALLSLCAMPLGGANFLPNEVSRVVGQAGARVTIGSLPGNPQKPTAMH